MSNTTEEARHDAQQKPVIAYFKNQAYFVCQHSGELVPQIYSCFVYLKSDTSKAKKTSVKKHYVGWVKDQEIAELLHQKYYPEYEKGLEWHKSVDEYKENMKLCKQGSECCKDQTKPRSKAAKPTNLFYKFEFSTPVSEADDWDKAVPTSMDLKFQDADVISHVLDTLTNSAALVSTSIKLGWFVAQDIRRMRMTAIVPQPLMLKNPNLMRVYKETTQPDLGLTEGMGKRKIEAILEKVETHQEPVKAPKLNVQKGPRSGKRRKTHNPKMQDS